MAFVLTDLRFQHTSAATKGKHRPKVIVINPIALGESGLGTSSTGICQITNANFFAANNTPAPTTELAPRLVNPPAKPNCSRSTEAAMAPAQKKRA